LYCDFDFRVDDIVILNGTEYRVTAKNDWNSYGFRKYELAEGYGGKLS
jgi:hypothetical protein